MPPLGYRTTRKRPQPSCKADDPLALATYVVIGDTPIIQGKIPGFSSQFFARFRGCYFNHIQRGLGQARRGSPERAQSGFCPGGIQCFETPLARVRAATNEILLQKVGEVCVEMSSRPC
ncbi:hypothetical protein Tsp_04787 [Trichinella spiralis]|uniref:hypothetical protein n=1 Tax=Trichinella spiralis TaxID=6334 RepID=UPI0001EFDE11|nr:hypothetical protein Tsp_04787 [Trichinella spiralis]